MRYDEYLEIIRLESALLADTAAAGSLDAPVLSCAPWNMADLVRHVGIVQHKVGTTVERRAQERPSFDDPPDLPEAQTLLAWFRDSTRFLLSVLRATNPETPMWTFTSERTALFWARRQAHEVTVHRWDAQHAFARAESLTTSLAVDGIGDVLAMLPAWLGDRLNGDGETLRLICTDAEACWLLRLGESGLEVLRACERADVTVQGTASDLDLFLWGRMVDATLTVSGDMALFERFRTCMAC